MRLKSLLAITLFVSACTALPFPGMSGGGNAKQTSNSSSHSSTTTTEEMNVNGRPVPVGDDDDDNDDDKPRKKKSSKRDDDKGDIGKTCHKNKECLADACFVGRGDLGYCTKMCNSWSDCPSHWECKKPGNAPQRICMQDSW